MNQIGTEILVILPLLLVNGVFAATEMAVVSARRGHLKRLADQGDPRARAALNLAESPNRFLSTVQVGITLVGVLAGAFGGATIAGKIAAVLEPIPPPRPYAQAIGVGKTFEAQGYRVEVLDTDRHRVDKVLVEPLPSRFAKPTPNQQETTRE